MNFDRKIDDALQAAKDALSQAETLKKQYEQAKDFTAIFLDKCKARDITKVSIGVKTKKIPATQNWPFGFRGSVFSFVPKTAPEDGDSHATRIWRVVDEMGISGSCGNSDQHLLASDGDEKLIDGVYEFRADNWNRTEQ